MATKRLARYGAEVDGAGTRNDGSERTSALRFVPPPGWPHPDEDWTAGHQGWQPRKDWVPLDGLPSAPEGWRFWEPNPPVWARLTERPRRSAHISAGISAVALILGAILTLQGLMDPSSRAAAYIAYPVVALAGVLGLLRYPFALLRITRATTATAVEGAAPEMHRRDRAAYEGYLAAIADREPSTHSAQSYDQFADEKERGAWAPPPDAPIRPRSASHVGGPEFTSLRREPLAIAAGAVGALGLIGLVLLIVVLGRSLLPGAGLPGAGLPGAGLPGAGLPGAASADPGAVGFSVSDATTADLTGLSCSSDIGCWAFRITLDESCTGPASALVEFAEAESGAPTDLRRFPLPDLEGGTTAVLVVPAAADSPDFASVVSVSCS